MSKTANTAVNATVARSSTSRRSERQVSAANAIDAPSAAITSAVDSRIAPSTVSLSESVRPDHKREHPSPGQFDEYFRAMGYAAEMPPGVPESFVDRYLGRIGYDGARDPTLASLQAIVACHTEAIAFENLTPLTAAAVRLEPAALEEKMVAGRRGGYCFEHNLLLCDALEQLGFHTVGLAARVVWNRPEGPGIPPRTHMLVRVELDDGSYVVDTGFGGLTLTGVLRLQADLSQRTPHEPFRLVAAVASERAADPSQPDGELQLQALLGERWRPLYQFSLQPQQRIDYEVANWYVSTLPESLFVQHLMAGRPTPDRRFGLMDNTLSVHHRDGPSERTVLTSVQALESSLERDFLLDLAGLVGLRAALQRFL